MARKVNQIQDASSDHDDAPEVVLHAASKADAKRNKTALLDFTMQERARKKARNRERDQKLKERARVTKGGKMGDKSKGVRFMKGEDEGGGDSDSDDNGDDNVEARMLRAMKDAAGEMEEDDDDDDDEFKGVGFGEGVDLGDDMASDSDGSSNQDEDDEDNEMLLGEGDLTDPEAPTDDEELTDEDEEDEITALSTSKRKADYLADDLFAAAFALQNSKPPSKKKAGSSQQQTTKKQRRKSVARPKDLVVGGRTVRTLPLTSDPRSQATSRSVPSARARRFMDQNLALKGKRAILKAKGKGWERRSANVGVMKYHGAPHGFVQSTR